MKLLEDKFQKSKKEKGSITKSSLMFYSCKEKPRNSYKRNI